MHLAGGWGCQCLGASSRERGRSSGNGEECCAEVLACPREFEYKLVLEGDLSVYCLDFESESDDADEGCLQGARILVSLGVSSDARQFRNGAILGPDSDINKVDREHLRRQSIIVHFAALLIGGARIPNIEERCSECFDVEQVIVEVLLVGFRRCELPWRDECLRFLSISHLRGREASIHWRRVLKVGQLVHLEWIYLEVIAVEDDGDEETKFCGREPHNQGTAEEHFLSIQRFWIGAYRHQVN